MSTLSQIHCRSLLYMLVRLGLIVPLVAARMALAQDDPLPTSPTGRVADSPPTIGALAKPSTPAVNPWTAATSCPANAYRYGFAQNGEDFYVISGTATGPNTTNVWRYNAPTNIWTKRASIPGASLAPAAAFSGGKIYVASGDGGGATFYIYDVATDVWTTGASRPGVIDSYGAAAGAFDGRVYIIGGGAAGPTSTVSIYNIATNTWSAGPASPSPVQLAGYAQIGQFLYVIGGFTNTPASNSSASMRLDMANNIWSTGPAFTPQRGDFALAAAGARLIAIGGDANGGTFFDPTALVNELDTTNWPLGTWVASPDNLPSVRQGNAAGFSSAGRVGGEIWSTGGATVTFISEHLFRAAPLACVGYSFTTSAGSIVPGTVDTGNHVDDGATVITLPFSYQFYDQSFTNAAVGSNGHLTFGALNNSFSVDCIPVATATYAIGPYWTDQCTGACTGVSGAGLGIFTSVSGVAPHRIFNIEWRTAYYNSGGAGVPLNYEVRLYEGEASFDVIYGTVSTFSPSVQRLLSVGAQKNSGAGQLTLEGCDSTGGTSPPVSSGQLYHYTLGSTVCVPPAAQTGFLYILNDNTAGNQIYGFSINETTGVPSPLAGFPVSTGGTGSGLTAGRQLALDSVHQRLYAVNDGSDTVSAYSINPTTGALSVLPFSPIALGGGVWQIAVHPTGSPLVVGTTAGQVKSFSITTTTATPAAGSPYSTGSAAAFSSVFSRDGSYYYVGGNTSAFIAGFSVNTGNGVLTALGGSPFNSGANNPAAYAADSQGRLLSANIFAATLRAFTTSAGVPTGVTGNPFASGLTGGEDGVLHPSEQFYFVADRAGSQVGSYRISGSGSAMALAAVTGSPFVSDGMFTDVLAMNQTGAYLYSANGNSRNLTTYSVNLSSGALSGAVVQPADTLGTAGRLTGMAYTNSAFARSAVSRKTHGAAGTFDINLPLTGTPGVECRNGAVAGDHQILITFTAPVTASSALVGSGTGNVGSASLSGGVVTVNLTGVANAQTLTVKLANVSDGVNTSDITIPISFLSGDVSGNGIVNASDVSQTKLQSGQVVTATNFREDVNVNGSINATDVSSVKAKSGTALP